MTAKTLTLTSLFLIVSCGLACRFADHRTTQGDASGSPSEKTTVQPVQPLDREGLRRLVTERNGRILFMNVWATWCAPCVEEFPDLVKLSRAYTENDVEVVGISVDYVDEIETKIVPFLKKQNVPFRIYVAQFEHQEDFINAVDKSWNGALPASFIFDPDGKQRFFLVGEGTFEQFKKEINKLKGAQ